MKAIQTKTPETNTTSAGNSPDLRIIPPTMGTEQIILHGLAQEHKTRFPEAIEAGLTRDDFDLKEHRDLFDWLAERVKHFKHCDIATLKMDLGKEPRGRVSQALLADIEYVAIPDTDFMELVGTLRKAGAERAYTRAVASAQGRPFDEQREIIARAEKALAGPPNAGGSEVSGLASLFHESTWSADGIYKMHLPDSPAYLGPMIREGTLGTIFAPRGLGKTWLSTAIGAAIAEGRDLGEWKSDGEPRTALIIDGEMSLRDTRDRIRLLGVRSERLKFLHHEVVYEVGEQELDLATKSQQKAVLKYCDEIEAKVVILDNLSSLFTGVAENDADAWGAVQPWLLALRRRKIAVIVVGHAGRNGEWRGSSKREDVLNWILKLKPKGARDDDRPGAEFVSVFTKNRGATNLECGGLVWRFNAPETEGGTVTIECHRHGGYEAFLECVREGIEQNSEIAEELGISKGNVSKFAKRAEGEGWLKIDGRRYVATAP